MKRKGFSPGRWLDYFSSQIYVHLILPFQETHAPLWEVARGAVVGLFIGLTPTMGVQIWLTVLVWLLLRYGLRFQFHLGIALALVWVSNPVTVLPLYFLYLKTGNWVLEWGGYVSSAPSFTSFHETLTALGHMAELSWVRRLVRGLWVVIVEFGWPIVVGSLVYAVPFAVLSYPFTRLTLRRYRLRLAEQEGISYAEWRRRYEHVE